MDNSGDLIGLVAGGVWLRGRQWHSPDSSLAGRSCDRFDIQPGHRPTHDLKHAPVGERHTEDQEWLLSRLRATLRKAVSCMVIVKRL